MTSASLLGHFDNILIEDIDVAQDESLPVDQLIVRDPTSDVKIEKISIVTKGHACASVQLVHFWAKLQK